MAAAGVPTARALVCRTADEAASALDDLGAPFVVKDDGLAAGKGVVVTGSRDEALAHASACVAEGGRVVVEEYLDGPEISLFAITDGTTVRPLPPAQDFKRIFDGEEGPNTGGWAPTRCCRGRRRTSSRRCSAPCCSRPSRAGPPRHAVLRAAVRRSGADVARPAGRGVQRPLRRPRDAAAAGAARVTPGLAAAWLRPRAPWPTCRLPYSPTARRSAWSWPAAATPPPGPRAT